MGNRYIREGILGQMKYYKKRILIITLLVSSLLSACSLIRTKLTAENYSDYLKIKATTDARFKGNIFDENSYWTAVIDDTSTVVYPNLTLKCSVRGASTNFNYNDVSLQLKITITCRGVTRNNEIEEKVIKEFINIDTDIAGNADTFIKEYSFDGYGVNNEFIDTKVEVLEISGSVSKAK